MSPHAFTNGRVLLLTFAAVLALAPLGCRKPGAVAAQPEEPVTGSPSDPPVALQATWNPTNRYVFRFELTSSSPTPRRNVPQPVTQESTVGEDFSLMVTNLAEDGTRRMELEILSVQMENSVGDNITLSYDSESRVGNTDENGTIARLEKFKGLKFAFKVSAENKITGSDGLRNMNDRLGGGNGRGGGPMGRLIDPKLFRELIEMNALPRQPVRIGETWTVRPDVSGGPSGNLPVDVVYTFKGWQKRNGRECARIDFSGPIQPPAPERNNRRGGGGPGNPVVEGGSFTGSAWFDPAVALLVETVSDLSLSVKGTMGGRGGRRPDGTNAPAAANPSQTWTGVVKQHGTIKLSMSGGT